MIGQIRKEAAVIIIFFCSDQDVKAERLLTRIVKALQGHRIEIYRSQQALSDRFHVPVAERVVLILAPKDLPQLQWLISLSHLFNDNPILLVLPDEAPETISLGHRLYPRFVTTADGETSDLVAVLGRLITNEARRRRAWENDRPGMETSGEGAWRSNP